jgi:hypothetical protein
MTTHTARTEHSEAPAPPRRDRPVIGGAGLHRAYGSAALGAAVTVAAVAALLLFPYVVRHAHYPLGWDAPAYVARINTVALEGLETFGTIRAASPLLFSVLMKGTGQNAFTLVAIVPAVLAGVIAVGAAALAAAGLGISPAWTPVIGFLAWAGFGFNGMINLHLDNLVNAALVLPAFAGLVAYQAGGRGLVAVAILLMAAGLAHWPFFVFAAAVYTGAVLLFILPWPRSDRPERSPVRTAARLLAPVGVSGAFVGLTFLGVPESGWVGARLGKLSDQLRTRFLDRLGDPFRYYAVPLAALGAVAAATVRDVPSRTARRLFLALMVSWIGATIAGGVAQWLGFPSAGARLLHYLFAVPILTGVLVWVAARALRSHGGVWGVAGAASVVILVVGGFAALAAGLRADNRSWIPATGVRQATASQAYLDGLPADQPVVYILGTGTASRRPGWAVIKAALDPREIPRAFPYYGSPEDFQAGVPSRPHGDDLAGTPGAAPVGTDRAVAIVVERFNPIGFEQARVENPERVVAPGLLILEGSLPETAPVPGPPPRARTDVAGLVGVSAAVLALLYLAGTGWAIGLLPPMPAVRVGVAPGLGVAAIVLFALALDRIGLPITGWGAIAPLALAAVGGWALAWVRLGRDRRSAAVR